MNKNNPTDVSAAFELLLEEIEIEINSLNKAASKASEEHDRKKAREALERADQIAAFRAKVVSLRKEWETLAKPNKDSENKFIHGERRNMGRLQRGVRTREDAFYQPILKVLNGAGGPAKVNDVLAKVEQLMREVLTQVDYEPLPSQPETPRWSNTAQWARNTMVKEGLLKSTSPRGVWEITEAGRQFLKEGPH
jgi:restriction system protein